jgi:hypothetical protein
MEPLAGLSFPTVRLWFVAPHYLFAANRGMPLELKFSSIKVTSNHVLIR